MAWAPEHRSDSQSLVLQRARARAAADPSALVVFDLDGCLFDNRPRQIAILRAFDAQHDWEALRLVEPMHFSDWDLARTLRAAGVPENELELRYDQVRSFWFEHFFDGEWLRHDRAMPGAVALVREVAATGCHVLYLTGRHQPMHSGTWRALCDAGFPLDGERQTLACKPRIEHDDTSYKVQALADRTSSERPLALFFDNEPANVNAVSAAHPEAMVVFVDTDHSPRPDRPDPELPVVRGFLA